MSVTIRIAKNGFIVIYYNGQESYEWIYGNLASALVGIETALKEIEEQEE